MPRLHTHLLLQECGMDKQRPGLEPDLSRETDWGAALAYYTPDLAAPESVTVLFESKDGDVIDMQTLPPERGFEVWSHPTLHSTQLRRFLRGEEVAWEGPS